MPLEKESQFQKNIEMALERMDRILLIEIKKIKPDARKIKYILKRDELLMLKRLAIKK